MKIQKVRKCVKINNESLIINRVSMGISRVYEEMGEKNTRLQLSQRTLFAGLLKRVLYRVSTCVKSWLGHFRVPKILNFQMQNLSCENEFYFHKKKQFSSKSFAVIHALSRGNLEWAIFPDCFTLPRYALWLIKKRVPMS